MRHWVMAALVVATVAGCGGGGGGGSSRTTLPPSLPVTIDTASVPDGEVGAAYSATLTASNGVTTAYAWSLLQGALPPGLTLDNSGATVQLSGTPTA
ncbi:MAG TPA: putative Ig domain-containing protein, partial [Planctomycetota bacterium]|nr:putative Ig domain-containing protein [Planctomycetota bacterium]